jgi:hypothetical protein
MREAQRRKLLFGSTTANSRSLVASLLGMTKIGYKSIDYKSGSDNFGGPVTDKAAGEKQLSVARRTAEGSCPNN